MVPAHDTPAGQQDFFLESSKGFKNVLHEYGDRSFDFLEYDDTVKAINYSNEKKYLSCLVWVQEHGMRFDIPLCALQANTDLSSATEAEISFSVLSGAVADALVSLLSGTYSLHRVGDALQYEMSTAGTGGGYRESVTIQVYDSGRVFATFEAGSGSAISKATFSDTNSGADFSAQDAYLDESRILASYDFDVDTADFSGQDQLDGGHGLFWIGSAAGEGDKYLGLNIVGNYAKAGRQSYMTDEIVIEIPDKADNSSESREFLFVLRPRGSVGRKATIKFVTPQGDPI